MQLLGVDRKHRYQYKMDIRYNFKFNTGTQELFRSDCVKPGAANGPSVFISAEKAPKRTVPMVSIHEIWTPL